MTRTRLALVVGFVLLAALLAVGLRRDPREIPSPLIGKPAPAFSLATLDAGGADFSPASMRGKVWLLNVWASWCASCREEHPVLMDFARRHEVPLIGLDYKDDPVDARRVLAGAGDPYGTVALDTQGRVGIDYGVYGVPETYVIDPRGVIVHKHIGPLTQDVIDHEIRPLLRKLSVSRGDAGPPRVSSTPAWVGPGAPRTRRHA